MLGRSGSARCRVCHRVMPRLGNTSSLFELLGGISPFLAIPRAALHAILLSGTAASTGAPSGDAKLAFAVPAAPALAPCLLHGGCVYFVRRTASRVLAESRSGVRPMIDNR